MTPHGERSITGRTPSATPKDWYTIHQACLCDHCGGLNVAVGKVGGLRNETDDLSDALVQRWVPDAVQPVEYEHVPKAISSVASEAHGCRSAGHLRGAVALARSVVESTAKAKGITSGSLDKKIDQTFENGLIREHVKEAAHEVRFGGNEVAHGDLIAQPLSVEDATEILGLMDEILEEVFESPGRVAERKRKRLERKGAGQAPIPVAAPAPATPHSNTLRQPGRSRIDPSQT
ncbi:MAG: hypothetical protein JWL99_4741 [Streptomyces oryziradicis]|nr:hypothetical protein [Actinacidiphila oryziradicis]